MQILRRGWDGGWLRRQPSEGCDFVILRCRVVDRRDPTLRLAIIFLGPRTLVYSPVGLLVSRIVLRLVDAVVGFNMQSLRGRPTK